MCQKNPTRISTETVSTRPQSRNFNDLNPQALESSGAFIETHQFLSKFKILTSKDHEKTHKIKEHISSYSKILHIGPNLHLPSKEEAEATLNTQNDSPENSENSKKYYRKKPETHKDMLTGNIKEHAESDISSNRSSIKPGMSFNDQIFDIKKQLADVHKKVIIGEDRISEEYMQNYELKLTVMMLQNKLEEIKDRNYERKICEAKCKSCVII
ncbi:hypothetical protein SteCoe_8893 [Stentor coeruleus]|uniref:Uncharacterized protein n=1 Tax=Stentor coeruleus TaxID=5963 RepID=A0A1R2CJ86_9CILI|nr:hypothetical protein SteCoe_8893 [Stentor coeruleus]